MKKYVIVGNGIAGITAAQAIVRADSDAELHVLGSEAYPYYQRPRLWELIAGDTEQDKLYFRSLEWYKNKGIQVHVDARVTALDIDEHLLSLADGTRLDYDQLLLATGARAFVPPIAGAEKSGVFVLRSLDDALAIKEQAKRSSSAAVIGGGLLGLETARALHSAGLDVTVIEFAPRLLPRQLDSEGARVLQSLLEAQGLRILTDAETEAIRGDAHATDVRLKDGRTVNGELVLISTGIRSRIELAREAGLDVNRGVVVDKHLRTSVADVYAAGDVAEFNGIVYGIIPAAIEQARIAATNMIEPGSSVYRGTLPATTLKVVGVDLASLGQATASGDEYDILRSENQAIGVYRRLTLRDGKIVGAILLGDSQNAQVLKKLITSKHDVSVHSHRLLDKDFDLRSLLDS
ncbi:MAG: FAD-dependent oxidoreductase [Chloroflexota bacterium]|nr:FAD-dependent oxidoreductase [Chloroflexota bacterium]